LNVPLHRWTLFLEVALKRATYPRVNTTNATTTQQTAPLNALVMLQETELGVVEERQSASIDLFGKRRTLHVTVSLDPCLVLCLQACQQSSSPQSTTMNLFIPIALDNSFNIDSKTTFDSE
jgi:hypothetical protein